MRFATLLLAVSLGSGCATTVGDFDFNVPAVTADSGPIEIFQPPIKGHKGQKLALLLVPVHFDDHEEACILDTGAAGSVVIGSPFFKALPAAGYGWVNGVGGRWEPAYRVRAEHMRIGARSYDSHAFTVLDSDQAMVPGVDCLIGMDLLAGSTLHFDFANHRFEMLQGIPPEIPTVPLVLTNTGDIVIPVRIAGHEVMGIWDSGNSLTAIDRRVVEADASFFHPYQIPTSTGIDALGRTVNTKLFSIENLELAGRRFPKTIVRSLDLRLATNVQPTVLLGLDLLEQREWFFDLVKRRWAVR